jgi:hypothetical protein
VLLLTAAADSASINITNSLKSGHTLTIHNVARSTYARREIVEWHFHRDGVPRYA